MKPLLSVVVIAAVAMTVVATSLAAANPAAAADVSDSPIVSTSFNDTVNAVAVHEGTVFSGGEFEYASTDGRRYARSYLASTSSRGQLNSFAPELNGPVNAVAVDDEYLYVAGTFSQVDGVTMRRVARFFMYSGELDTGFKVSIDALPRALELSGGLLYIGGDFNTVNGTTRNKVAAVKTYNGALTGFAPKIDHGVRSVEVSNGHVYIGGGFTTVNGTAAGKLASLNPDTGALETGFAPKPAGTVFDVHADDGRIYTAEGGLGGRVHAYNQAGKTLWQRTTDGDVVTLTLRQGTIYAGGHFDQVCRNAKVGDKGKCLDGAFADRGKLLAVSSENSLRSWNPDADSVVGTLSLASGGSTVAAGGSFLTFASGTVKQRGLALFRQ